MSLERQLNRAFLELERSLKRAERRGRDAAKKVLGATLNKQRAKWPRDSGRSAQAFRLRARTFPDEVRFTVSNKAKKFKGGVPDYYSEHIQQGVPWKRFQAAMGESTNEAAEGMAKAVQEAVNGS